MFKFLSLALMACLASYAVSAQYSPSELKLKVQELVHDQPGTYAVAFKDLQNGNEILINAQEQFHAASTMKTPVMIEVFKQVQERKFLLEDSIEIKNQFHSIVDGSLFSLNPADDSDSSLYTVVGKKRTIKDLLKDMITYSSNLATNIIIEKVGAENVTRSMRKLGAERIQVLRGVEDGKAYEKGLNNTTTAYDLMLIFESIANGNAVSSPASTQMIDILLQQHFNELIPGKLPKNVKVAHKTGNISGVLHDSGIVFLPDGRKYVLVLLSKDIPGDVMATDLLSKISRLIYDGITSND